MAFDLSTARPVTSEPATSGGFDLSTAKPVIAEPEKKLTLPQYSRKIGKPEPTNWQVALNAVPKGAAAVGDMVGNAGVNAINLLTAGGGAIAYETGIIDNPPDLPLQSPDMFRKTGEAVGAINPDYNPQTKEQRYIDAGVQSATGALLTGGSGGVRQALANTAGGVVGGEVAQLGAETGHPILGLLGGAAAGGATAAGVNRLTGATANTQLQQQRAVTDANFMAARDAGLIIPASQSNPRSIVANSLDVIAGGRPRMQQAAAIKNQPIVNNMASRALGLPDDTPLTPDLMQAIRNEAIDAGYNPVRNSGMVTTSPQFHAALDNLTQDARTAQTGFANYDHTPIINAVESVRTNAFDAGSGIAQMRILRDEASTAFRNGNNDMGRALRGASDAIENELEAHLARQGNPEALQNFRNARQRIAMTASVEDALNQATGNVSAQNLGRQLDRGVPLSGNLRAAAIASKLPGASLANVKYGTTGASQLENAGSIALSTALGNIAYLGLPLARAGLRETLLTRPVSNYLGTPNYNRARLTGDNLNALMVNTGLAAERQSEQ